MSIESPKRINDDLEGFIKSNGFGLQFGTDNIKNEDKSADEPSFENELALHLPIHTKNNTSKSNKKF